MLVQFGVQKAKGVPNPTFLFLDCYEVSDPEDQKIGLSGATHLPPGTGMLFVFDSEQVRTFHMPPTVRFPIDIIFIGANGKVTELAEHCQPGSPGNVQARARWVLECQAGTSEHYQINVGDMVQLESDNEGSSGMGSTTA